MAEPTASSRDRLLRAGRHAFSSVGFEGASLRAIAIAAGLQHTLLLYHFKTKDQLWQAVMTEILDLFEARIRQRLDALGDETPPEHKARALLKEFVYFCAEVPELHRIMTIEGRIESDRLNWLVERYSRPAFEMMQKLTTGILPKSAGTPIQWFYAMIGLSASPFVLAPEYWLLSGVDPFSLEEVESHARFVETLVFGEVKPA